MPLLLILLAPPASAQTTSSLESPLTRWGRPDLNGVWDFRTATPLQRPRSLEAKATLTEEEATTFEQEFARGVGGGNATGFPGATDADFELWFDIGTHLTDNRTSLIIDPPDGRIPARTAAGQQRAAPPPGTVGLLRPADGPEDRTPWERCMMTRVPIRPAPAPNWFQLFQTEHHVAIFLEDNHGIRIIPLDSPADVSADVPQWRGVSRGHWEGDTLVVETSHFDERASFFGSGPGLQLIERFTRLDATTLNYEFTVNDPESFTRPWTASQSMALSDGVVYEYACHEGNYSIPLILRGARTLERSGDDSR